MEHRDIWMTDFDLERLRKLLAGTRVWSSRDRQHLERLDEELARAHVVSSADIPPDVVTMNSRLRLRDLDSGQDLVFTLVFPSDADAEQGKVSVLAPLGTAVLGFRRGDAFEWHMPGRVRRLRVDEVLYQPEAAGDHHL
jgi:regulator of nucleoside diphosphate kinase